MVTSHNKSKYAWAVAIILLWSVFFPPRIPAVRAEPYLRVNKNGIIYYYFSNCETKLTEKSPFSPGRTHNFPPQFRHRLSTQDLEPLIREVSRNHNLPPALIKALIKVESNFNPAATSPKGAQGLMQLMPQTACDLQVANPYDIRENIWAGTSYLGALLQKFNFRLPLALAAYNAGPERVRRHQGIPAIKETQDFVRDVCVNFLRYSGGPVPDANPPIDFHIDLER